MTSPKHPQRHGNNAGRSGWIKQPGDMRRRFSRAKKLYDTTNRSCSGSLPAPGSCSTQQQALTSRSDLAQNDRDMETKLENIKGQENVKRALEVARLGGHTVTLVGPDGCGKHTLMSLFQVSVGPDMVIEVVRPSAEMLLSCRKAETMEAVNKRLGEALKETDLSLPEAGKQLLKTAYDRLELSPADLFKCIDIARTIANLHQSKHIRVEHLAEAIQYKSYKS